MDFIAFLLLNAVLFIRPMEFVPALYGLPLYDVAFGLCIAVTLPELFKPGAIRSVVAHPIGICVLTMASIAVLSSLVYGGILEAVDTLSAMVKVILYYILLVIVVRTPSRLKWFLASIVVDGFIIAALGVADYKGFIKLPGLTMYEEFRYVNGIEIPFRRLGSTGLFGDPNDLSLLIVGCVVNCFYLASDRKVALPLRALWLVLPLPLLFQTLLLTYSRAGMLSLLSAVVIYAFTRYRWRVLVPIVLALPVVLGIGGRQMELNVSAGTAQSRIALWDGYITLFIKNPVLGVGYNHCMDYDHHVVHNSYLHAYVELGFLGGTAFLGAVGLSLVALWRLEPLRTRGLSPELTRLWPYLLAGVGCYAIGIVSLSRCYVVPTFSTLGLAAAYERMALAPSPRQSLRLSSRAIGILLVSSLAFLVLTYIFVKSTANYY